MNILSDHMNIFDPDITDLDAKQLGMDCFSFSFLKNWNYFGNFDDMTFHCGAGEYKSVISKARTGVRNFFISKLIYRHAINLVGCSGLIFTPEFKDSNYVQMLRDISPEIHTCELKVPKNGKFTV